MSKNGSNPPLPGNRSGAFYRYDFLPDKRRIHARYIGSWSEQIAHDALNAFRQALERASAGGQPLTLLDDFRDWQAQTPQVTAIANGFEAIWRPFSIRRNAMIIPDARVRMQVRRTLTDFHLSKIFENYEEADKWLAEAEQGT